MRIVLLVLGTLLAAAADPQPPPSPASAASSPSAASQPAPPSLPSPPAPTSPSSRAVAGRQPGRQPGQRCRDGSHCQSRVCEQGKCAAASCSDQVANGDETDVDCGGICAACLAQKRCLGSGDCQSGVCIDNRCAAASCTDRVRNGAESDADCGGLDCSPCDEGKRCFLPRDCASAACEATLCAPPLSRQIFATVEVNGGGRGEAQVILRRGGDVLVQRSLLAEVGLVGASQRADRAGRWPTTGQGGDWVSLASLAPILGYRFDERSITLSLTAQAAAFAESRFDLSGVQRPEKLIYRRDTSGFANYSVQLFDFTQLSTFVEGGLSIRGALLGTTASLSSDTWLPVRGLSSVTFDERSRLMRFIFGDGFATTGLLGGGAFVGGLTVGRVFAIDPYFVHYPMLGYSGTALTPSTLEVYSNGMLVRRQPLPPGPFRLDNVPVTTGSGNVTYVVRDAFGNQSSVSAPYYVATALLRKGLHDFSYSLGFRRDGVGSESFAYGPPLLLARHAFGVSDRMTVGLRLEASLELLSGGALLAVGTRLGQLELAVAGSGQVCGGEDGSGGAGVAGSLGWAYMGRRFSTGLWVGAASDHYATLSTAASADRATVEGRASASVPLTTRLGLQLSYALSLYRDTGFSDRATALLNWRLYRQLTLLASAGSSDLRGGGNAFEAALTLTAPLANRTVGSAGWEQRDRDGAVVLQMQKMLPEGPGYGVRLTQELGWERQRSSGLVEYQSPYGHYSAGFDLTAIDRHGSLEVSGSIVGIAGAGVFAARPVYESFAVIQVPGIKGVHGYLDNQEIGRTNRRGNLVVPKLLAYYANRLSIAELELPADLAILSQELTLAPSYRAGVLALFPPRRARFFRGRVVIEERGQRVALRYGEFTLRAGERSLTTPIGPEGDFELDNPQAGGYSVEVEWERGRCRTQLQIPESNVAVHELGELRCTVPETGR